MERLKLVTLNIWNKQGPWPERLALIRAELEALDADIVGLQEVLRSDQDDATQADEIADALAGGAYPHRAYGARCTSATR